MFLTLLDMQGNMAEQTRSAFRLHNEASQAAHDVGSRVVCEEGR